MAKRPRVRPPIRKLNPVAQQLAALPEQQMRKDQTISVQLGFNLTETQLQAILTEYVGWPNTEATRRTISMRLHQHVVIAVTNTLELDS